MTIKKEPDVDDSVVVVSVMKVGAGADGARSGNSTTVASHNTRLRSNDIKDDEASSDAKNGDEDEAGKEDEEDEEESTPKKVGRKRPAILSPLTEDGIKREAKKAKGDDLSQLRFKQLEGNGYKYDDALWRKIDGKIDQLDNNILDLIDI